MGGQPVSALAVSSIFVFGLCIGSFLNVVIYRLPHELSIVRPRSFCPHCRYRIAWYDNIPLVSFLLLGGKCRHCHEAVSPRYFLVELLTGLLFAGVFVVVGWGVQLVVLWTLTACLVASTFIDVDHRIIPDEITLPGMALGLIVSLVFPQLHHVDSPWLGLRQSLFGIIVGGGSLYVTGILGNAIFRRESMGGGDVKLLAMAGSILGWKLVLLAFFLAPILALLPGLVVLVTTKSHEIPYGPFLSLAVVVSVAAGQQILDRLGFTEIFDAGMPVVWEQLSAWFSRLGAGHE